MTLGKIKWRWYGWIIALVAAFFLTALVGWFREKHELQVTREQYKKIEIDMRAKIAQVGEGVPVDVFHQILPNAYREPTRGGWSISFPTGYAEKPSCTIIPYESRGFELEDGIVRPTWIGAGGKHMDRFGGSDLWYYFTRAWWSSLDSEE